MTVVKAAEFHEVQFWSVPITIILTKVKVELFKQNCAETVKNIRSRTAKKAQCSLCLRDTTTADSECFYVHGVPQCGTSLSSFILFSTCFLLVSGESSEAQSHVSPGLSAEERLRGVASPGVGPLFGGVVRSDHLRLRHHAIFILREGIAMEQVLL